MNTLTVDVVTYCARQHRSGALKSTHEFKMIVESEYWARLMLDFGIERKFHAIALFSMFHPECVDSELGYALTDEIEVAISDIVVRSMERRIANNPDIHLDDYGTLAVEIVDRLTLEEEAAKIAAKRAKRLEKTEGMEQLSLF